MDSSWCKVSSEKSWWEWSPRKWGKPGDMLCWMTHTLPFNRWSHWGIEVTGNSPQDSPDSQCWDPGTLAPEFMLFTLALCCLAYSQMELVCIADTAGTNIMYCHMWSPKPLAPRRLAVCGFLDPTSHLMVENLYFNKVPWWLISIFSFKNYHTHCPPAIQGPRVQTWVWLLNHYFDCAAQSFVSQRTFPETVILRRFCTNLFQNGGQK